MNYNIVHQVLLHSTDIPAFGQILHFKILPRQFHLAFLFPSAVPCGTFGQVLRDPQNYFARQGTSLKYVIPRHSLNLDSLYHYRVRTISFPSFDFSQDKDSAFSL